MVKAFQVGLIAATLGILLRQGADNTLRNTVGMMYFWIFVALARNIATVRWNAFLVVEDAEPARLVPAEAARDE